LLECMDEIKLFETRVAKQQQQQQQQMSGSRGNGGGEGRVIVLAATNTPKEIDTAFLRPGRFDCVVYVGLPNEEERREIMTVVLKDMKVSPCEAKPEIARRIADLSEGMSGADLSYIVNAAALSCLNDMNLKEIESEGEEDNNENEDDDGVELRHFLEATKNRIKKGGGSSGQYRYDEAAVDDLPPPPSMSASVEGVGVTPPPFTGFDKPFALV
jgi:SpoVK/Ycf46/Vps4 family AAA+-type ATPase